MLSDIKFALRLLSKTPGFTFVAILTMAIGIGAVTVAFSAANSVLFKPFPFIQHQERMLHFTEVDRNQGRNDMGIAYPDFVDLHARMTTLEGIWVYTDRTVILSGTDEPERLLGTELSWDGFALMGVSPILGRNFTAEDARPESPTVALLSYGLWHRRFAGDEAVLNQSIQLNGQAAQIIGVMPEGWGYPETSTIWTVFRPAPEMLTQRANYYLEGHAMMKAGISLKQVQAESDTIMHAIALEYRTTNTGIAAQFQPVREEATDEVGQLTLLLVGAVLFVFLIACLNVANLLLARSVTRSKEIAIRLALGATRRRLIRQFIVESVVLAIAGGVGGLVLGLWGVDAMWQGVTVEVPFWLREGFDLRVFGVVFGLTLISSLVIGLVPALQATRPDISHELKDGGRGMGQGGAGGNRLRSALVVAEVALALVLLVGAGLMMRSFREMSQIPLGFRPENILTFRVGLPPSMLQSDDESRQFFTQLVNRLSDLPGITAATATTTLPLAHSNNMRALLLEGKAMPQTISAADIGQHRVVLGDYWGALSVSLLRGRTLDSRIDRVDTPRVVVVDQAFAERHYGGVEDALGKRFALLDPDAEVPAWMTIVGVVGNVRHALERADRHPTYYVPFAQDPANFMSIAVHTQGDPNTYLAAARREVLAVNPIIPIYNVATMETLFKQSAWSQSFFSHLFSIAALIALFLASIGVYGVMAYTVAQRTGEIGVRMALGAQSGAVVGLMLGRGLKLVGIGLILGFVVSWFAVQLLSGLLYGVSPHDPPTFLAVPTLLATVALIACYVPSRRATRIDPIQALRG